MNLNNSKNWLGRTGLVLATLSTLLFSSVLRAELNVFACEPEWGALVNELAGEKADVFNATTGLQDPHHIQARPSLIAKARRADLLVCTGAELEVGWLPLLIRKAGNPNILPSAQGHFMATDHVQLLGQPTVLDRSEGDVHAAGNPHIQTDPARLKVVAQELSKRLQEIDAGNRAFYAEKLATFMQRWDAAMARWQKDIAPLKGKSIVVHHNNWLYLEEWTGLKTVATLEPKPGVPPSPDYLSKLVRSLEQKPAKAILYASYQNNRSAKWLADRTNLPLVELPFTVSGSEEAKDLFSLFDETVSALVGTIK